MKKLYPLILIFAISIAGYGQTIFYDDFESYTGGNIPTCDIWSTSDGNPGNGGGILVVDDITIDNQSGYIGPGSTQDVMLDLRNQTSGNYTLQWEMYITAGSTGYFNIQGMTETNISTGCQAFDNNGVFNSSNIYFNNGSAAPGVIEDQTTGETGTYPEDAWFTVKISFDLTGGGTPTYQITVDDAPVNQNPVPFQADNVLGGINFFSIDSQNNYWLDNVLYTIGVPGPTTFEDGFETYNLGDMGNQNPARWFTWSGIPDDGSNIEVVEDIVHTGDQAGYIGPDSVQDCLLLLGNQTEGYFTLAFYMYLTGGSTGYFNIQGETLFPNNGSGVFNSSNLYFNNAGAAPGVFEDQTTGETGFYPEDEWFYVSIYFDLADPSYQISIDNTLVNVDPVPFQADNTLGAIDFFSIDANNNYWLDDVVFAEGLIAGVDDFSSANFKFYPNPVVDILNIQSKTTIDQIRIYDVMGRSVLFETPKRISPGVDMSELPAGIYFVKVGIGEASKTIKIIK